MGSGDEAETQRPAHIDELARRLFSNYERLVDRRTCNSDEDYRKGFTKAVELIAFMYRGIVRSNSKPASHDLIIAEIIRRSYHMKDLDITPEHIKGAIILAYANGRTGQPLMEWDENQFDDQEIEAYIKKGWQELERKQASPVRRYFALADELTRRYGMTIKPSIMRSYVERQHLAEQQEDQKKLNIA